MKFDWLDWAMLMLATICMVGGFYLAFALAIAGKI